MMEDYHKANRNGAVDNGHIAARHSYQPSMKGSLPWLDIRVFYVRVCKCELDDTTPDVLTLNHIPLNPDTLLEVNGLRTSIYSDGVSTLLKRDRVDRKSEEVTFVSTDSIRTSGGVKYEVFDNEVLLLSGVLELRKGSKGLEGDSSLDGRRWTMNCESDLSPGTSFFRGKQFMLPDSASPTIEVYIAGSFSGTPIILTKTLMLSSQKKIMRKGVLDAIPEHEADENQKHVSSNLALQLQGPDYLEQKPEDEEYNVLYTRTGYQEELEDGELSWFNAGVRVGVGIGLSVCLGIGIGVGLLIKTYQGTTRHFRRRLL
ncbi:uncharacterized protein At1g01500-like [Neltuma alba]|uniref:uncharacterized protein At1g01500-like n=1 Tax=Neltuma alba TaxID=207710 RepID=UPI0010A2AAD7|nr:uncharacterized protein At1g01500-like [Prosopis alba]XP_028765778.1 uncharacterized protein At1g01500-like [Prosopis alba]XP_028765779.1 uncharacterized protein At1g01500-like [Prosopis alba]XP_028765780.1 uncharacterized protein At1g01500-like [Prosopis alba]XP_028772668.1 uncharacterized protein At1g01500-like [Prosopis alba]XP_028772675.1 uncharacterized protein At1g01500-like [Prosopis alba]XP_028772681.1 uncharacterized protein At1g01500-like [Prosopis alba]XP_028772689.1 uncharacte